MSKTTKKAEKKVKTATATAASEEYVEGLDGFWEKYSS